MEDSPASRAGIHEGDELVEINGMQFINLHFANASRVLE